VDLPAGGPLISELAAKPGSFGLKEKRMPTIVLRDAEGTDLGFILIAGDEPLSLGPAQRDLVLMKLPFPSASPLSSFLDDYRHAEFSSQVQSSAAGASLSFQVSPNLSVTAEFSSSGVGTWSVTSIGSGTCQLLAK
jgi:hypothetical protein